MTDVRPIEHFVTLFDHSFLIHGLALHRSLSQFCRNFCLWIVCVDSLVHKQLTKMNLPNVQLLTLEDHETPELLSVKDSRTRGEYCFTITPFVPGFVFQHAPNIRRITYIDADLCFFDSPHLLLDEFEKSGRSVLITEHGYAPEYDFAATSGRFCVQFLTFNNDSAALEVLKWWQARCLEWCFNRAEDGKFGDQKYLDLWPTLFEKAIYVVPRNDLLMAPWNAKYLIDRHGDYNPVFFHFHSFRFIKKNFVVLFQGYRQFPQAHRYYQAYISRLKEAKRLMANQGFEVTRTAKFSWRNLYVWPQFLYRGEIAFAHV